MNFLRSLVFLTVMLIGCAKGPQGDNGTQGVTGPQGPEGVALAPSGSNPLPIMLCIGVEAKYLKNFPRWALCINNNLYGFYAENGGFMSILPPGHYESAGLVAMCVFTVSSNCVVSQ